jgi:hypothetical protein
MRPAEAFLRLSDAPYLRRRQPERLGACVPSPELGRFTVDDVAFARQAWTMRAEEEHHSAAVFSDLLSLLVDDAVPLDLTACVAGVVRDELRHTELCLDLAHRFGASPPRSRPLPRPPAPTTLLERRARGLAILLVEGAIGETISSALFAVGRNVADEPCTKSALGAILRDEVVHARLFWESLAALRPELSGSEMEELQRIVTLAFGTLERTQMLPVLRRLERGDPFHDAWAALGVLPPARRVDAFYGAIERRVMPRLRALGLDAGRAWRERYS